MSRKSDHEQIVASVIREHGQTYASEAGIRLQNGPASLFQVLCLSLLLSARIRASVAVSAMRALRSEGWTSPKKLVDSTWERRAKVLNESGYARYDERTATMLCDTSELLLDRYRGDLRRLRDEAGQDPDGERQLVKEFKGIGQVGADIFFREVQAVWPEVAPFFGAKVLDTAKSLGLPHDASALAKLCARRDDVPKLAAGLVRAQLGGKAELQRLREAA